MTTTASIILLLVTLLSVSAFAPITTTNNSGRSSTSILHQYATGTQQFVEVTDLRSPRDVYSMEQWATQYGLQKADGVELYSTNDEMKDYSLYTSTGIAAGQTALFVPSGIVLNSEVIAQEFSDGSLSAAEESLIQIDNQARFPQGAEYRLPLFRLMTKILVEYEKGTDSMYFPWLNSLPRQFYNGVSMTKVCFRCLPPYAGWLTQNERINCSHFTNALRQGYVPLSQETIYNKQVTQWAYNCALTRFHEIYSPQRAKLIGPMADMINHAAEPNCEIQVDGNGNMNVVSLYDIQPNEALSISYGEPRNPTPIFAKYGFLPNDCATIFCKAIHLVDVMYELNYDMTDLLIQTQTGEIAPPVWDAFLYDVLIKNDYNSAQQFSAAVRSGDEATKQQIANEWYPYTLDALKTHVNSVLDDAAKLTKKANKMDLAKHPRVPVIVAHNQLVSQTFGMTCQLLEQM